MVVASRATFLDGGGEAAAAVRDFNWSATSLGPIETWSVALRTAVGLMLNSKFPKCIIWGEDLITIHNDAFRPILGRKPPALGRPFNEVWEEVWPDIAPLMAQARGGEAIYLEDFSVVIERNGFPEQAYFTFCYSPIRDETGRIAGVMDTVIETTAKVFTERNIRLLNAELEHRIKNTLTMVAGIAGQTFRAAETLDGARATLMQRLMALSTAHSVLTRSSWSGAPIRTVIEGALEPHRTGEGQISLSGPPLDLSARQSLSLSLAVNELATNALKYGALSTPEGQIEISWTTGMPASTDPFTFTWRERGGPTVVPPTRRGFGSLLIEQALAVDFGGEVRMIFDSRGLRCELSSTMLHLLISAET